MIKNTNKNLRYFVIALLSLIVVAIFTLSGLQSREAIKNEHSATVGRTEQFVKNILRPQGLALNKEGKLFVQSSYDGKISMINKEGKAFDYTYLQNYSGNGIKIDRNDNILMASNDKVIRVDSFGRMIQEFEGFGKAYDIEIAADNTIFVSDSQKNQIIRILPNGISTVLVSFEGRSSSSTPNAAGIGFDKDFKNLYCVNIYSGDLYKISLTKDYQVQDMTIIASGLSRPNFLDIDTGGNVYITCLGDNSVVRVDQNSIAEVIDTNDKLTGPSGIVFDANGDKEGSLFVASKETNIIYKIELSVKNKAKK